MNLSLNLIAQGEETIGDPLGGFGPLGLEGGDAPSVFANIISGAIGLLTIIAGIYFIFVLITGAISWLSAGGDKGAVENARKRITSGLIGLIVVVSAIFIVRLIATLLGIEAILDPAAFINNFSLGP